MKQTPETAAKSAATKVNFAFISGLEGGPQLTGYVPDAAGSRSGVTVATGFDIGARSTGDLHRLLPAELADKFAPYALLHGRHAATQLERLPLTISADDAEQIDLAVKSQLLTQLTGRFDAASAEPFASLPEHAQTVIASVAFQYGNLARRCPTFWGCAVRQDWQGMLAELNDFGDRYPTRRKREATYLQLMGDL